MKFEKNPKYNTMALFALIVVAFAALLISLFTHADAVRAIFAKMARVLMPLLYAAILMLVLMPAVEFFERKFLPFCIARKMKKPQKKGLDVCAHRHLSAADRRCPALHRHHHPAVFGAV